MTAIAYEELWDLHRYERQRADIRPRLLAEKARRRLAAGEHLMFLFENHDTLWYQIQEMIRVERLTDPQAKADLPAGVPLSGEIFLEAQACTW